MDAAAPRVLVIFPGALGDLMCAMPALAAISRRHPGTSIELMAREELARLAMGRSVVARAHSIDRREVSALFEESSREPSRSREFFSQFDRIYSFFAADDARFRAALIASTKGAVSFHPFRPDGAGHVAEAYLQSIGESNPWLGESKLIQPNLSDVGDAKAALRSSGCDIAKLMVIFPGSGSQKKNWPARNFIRLALNLSKSASPVVVLGPAEENLAVVFRKAGLPVIEDLALGTVAAIARIASCFVGNDSGVSHLAATVGARGVVIFGPTDPARWRPLGQVAILRQEPIETLEPAKVETALRVLLKAPWHREGIQNGRGK